MAWGYNAVCPDCDHRWEGVKASLHLGPRAHEPDGTRALFCPHCSLRLDLPRALDRKAWQHWYKRFLAESPCRTEWVLDLLARIDAGFTSCSWYTPRLIDPGVVACPDCRSPLMPGTSNENHTACPSCGSLKPVAGVTSHITIERSADGFG